MMPGPRRSDEFHVPAALRRAMAEWNGDEGAAWIASLPERVADCERRLDVRAGRPFAVAQCAWVAPAGPGAVLKITFPHREAEHEADALEGWDGRGAVKLLARVKEHEAILIERCRPGTRLRRRPPGEVFDVSVAVLRELWSAPPGRTAVASLEEELALRASKLRTAGPPLDLSMNADAASLFDELPRTAVRSAIIHGDFHPDNVLAATREPWLVIDPKPFVGDVAFDTAQWLLNLGGRLDGHAIRRFADALELDRERVWGYLWARMVEESLWSFRNGRHRHSRRAIALARRFARERA